MHEGRPRSITVVLLLALGVTGLWAVPASAQTITSFTPASGTIGTVVTITGSGFTGVTGVRFNGAAAAYTVNSLIEQWTGAGWIEVPSPGLWNALWDVAATSANDAWAVSYTDDGSGYRPLILHGCRFPDA